MRLTITELRDFISEVLVNPSKESKAKDDVAKGLQELIFAAIKTGRVKDQNDLDIYFSKYGPMNADDATLLSIDSLSKVPFEIWNKMTKKK